MRVRYGKIFLTGSLSLSLSLNALNSGIKVVERSHRPLSTAAQHLTGEIKCRVVK